MDFERFQQFMLESAARHDGEIAVLRESLGTITETMDRVSRTLEVLVNNQVHLQEKSDADESEFRRRMEDFSSRMDDFRKAFVLHVVDPEAHRTR